MFENLHNDIDHPSSKSEILDEHFDEEENQRQRQALEQERKQWKSVQLKQASSLMQKLQQNNQEKPNNTVQEVQNSFQESEKKKWNKKNTIKYLRKLIKNNDIKWIFAYLWLNTKLMDTSEKIMTKDILDENLINEMESLSEPKNLANIDNFLSNEDDILNETQMKYESLYEKIMKIKEWNDDWRGSIFGDLLNKLLEQVKKLNNSKWFLYKKLIRKEIIKSIIEIKYVIKVKRKDFSKYLRQLDEYENWEYIDFPNWITFELWKWPEKIYWTNINIWENEFYIKTDIGKNWRNKKTKYIEYVDSLKKARKLFEKKWIKLRYCQRCTWLANREFIEAYEKERQKRKAKEWIAYEKTNRLKVLEQTEDAVISYRHSTEWKSPIRFIDKDENWDLFEFAQKNKYFGEAEMWLDLDKL